MTEHDLVAQQGVNDGSSAAERDRRPDGDPPATDAHRLPPAPTAHGDEYAGAPGDEPSQQLEAGEG